jgi:hypothetical protein
MRWLVVSTVLLCLVPMAAARAGDEVPPTPAAKPESAPQHVTVPSLPGQENKQGTVKPEGGMPMDSEGYAVTKRYDPSAKPSPAAAKTGARGSATPSGSTAGAGAQPATSTAAAPAIPIGPAPSGKAVATGANYLTVRGSVVAFEAGRSVTIRHGRTGTENTYTLAPGATVGKDVGPGREVRVRVLAAEKGKVADQVEVVPPSTPLPAKKEGSL